MRRFLSRISYNLLFVVVPIVLLSNIFFVQGGLAADPDNRMFTPDYQEINESANDYANAEYYDSYLHANSPGFPDKVDNEFPKISYADWDQSYCGNCWVWACTAAVAQSYKEYSGSAIPISVQFFNSNYFDGNIGQEKPHKWACTGGFPSQFAESYSAGLNQNYAGGPFVVPLSNPNAWYADKFILQSDQENLTTLRSKEDITTSPNLKFRSMTAKRLLVNQNLDDHIGVIDNLTEVLAEGRVIVYLLYWTDGTTASHFLSFWNYSNEDTSVYNPSYMDSIQYTGGPAHEMVIVGYNKTDPDPDKWYWIVQNSWGSIPNRPHGQFRLKMDMDYNASYYRVNTTGVEWQLLQQFWIINVDWIPDHEPVSNDAGSGDDDADDSYAASSPPVSAGQSMDFAINEPVTSTDPVGIVSVGVVPSTALGPTDLTVADADTADDSAFAGRQVADIESINLVGVNPSSVRGGTITFAVSGSWMRDHGVNAGDIVLMRNHDGTWAELPTTFDHVTGDTCYFTATTPGFSSFAVATRLNTTAGGNATANVTAATTGITSSPTSPVTAPVTAAMIVTTRATTVPQTTAVPAPADIPAGSSGNSALWIAAGICGIVIAATGGFLVRRWWIHRQNPALFRKYD